MAIKKTELYASLWASCDALRGGMDASQYKDYVLTLLFVKYISDKYKGVKYSSFSVPQGASFDQMVLLKGTSEIGDQINKMISCLAEANDLKGIIDLADFNDPEKLGKGQDMTDRLSALIGIFENIDLSSNKAEGDDLLGDAYEYLMRHFATESGKSKGQFYTPSEVSKILAKIIGISQETPPDMTVYDPTCGSGSLLLKANDEAPRGLSVYGQEKDNPTRALAKMNTILHNLPDADIFQGNTLSDPHFLNANNLLKQFDFAVANPPFSSKNWMSGLVPDKDPYQRFEMGVPPPKNGDYAFLLHMIKSLKSTGKGAIILPHGVLFRGNKEETIRTNLIKQGYIKGIIGLPANLFYGTGIPACIIVVDKEEASNRQDIFMIDASKGFIKDGNKNRLRSQDVHKIVTTFNQRLEIDRYSRMVPISEIMENNYNLNIPRYIDTSEDEDIQDLTAHLQGGIPNRDIEALKQYWDIFPQLKPLLFAPLRDGYSTMLVSVQQIKNTILNHDEFIDFQRQTLEPFEQWKQHSNLKEIKVGDQPKSIIHDLSEKLLQYYHDSYLIDKYDIYQILMNYWSDIFQDDVYLLVQDGWNIAGKVRVLITKKGEKLKEIPDLIIGAGKNVKKYKMDMIPPQLIINRYFHDVQMALNDLQIQLDEATQTCETYIEEHSGEDGLLVDALDDKDKVTKKSIDARLKITTDSSEIDTLKTAKKYINHEDKLKKDVKERQEKLNQEVVEYYEQLSIEEIQTLVINDKWFIDLQRAIEQEIERVTQNLINRLTELDTRYNTPLPELEKEVAQLTDKVTAHLKVMGLSW